MNGHLLALSEVVFVAAELVSHILDGESTPKQGPCLSVLGEDQILVLECCRRSNGSGLLSGTGHVEADAALALGGVEGLICLVELYHHVEDLQELLLFHRMFKFLVYHLAVFVNYSEAR